MTLGYASTKYCGFFYVHTLADSPQWATLAVRNKAAVYPKTFERPCGLDLMFYSNGYDGRSFIPSKRCKTSSMDKSLKIVTGFQLPAMEEQKVEIALPKLSISSVKMYRVLVHVNRLIGTKLSVNEWSMIFSFGVFITGLTFGSVITMLAGAILMAALFQHVSKKEGGQE